MRPEPVDLRALLSRVVQGFEKTARTQGVGLDLGAAGEPVTVRGDALRLEQIVTNLISNAIKYTNEGGRVSVTLAREGGQVELRVRDTGVGISAEMLPRVFDLFAQAPGALDRAQGGMGIGLTLVQRLVALHEGTVEAFSDGPGKGSEFVVRLPLLEGASAPAKAGVQPEAVAARKLRLVVAEDNADSRELLQVGLERLGHSVIPCADGNAAVERAISQRPDAVLIDLGLPGRDGFAVAHEIRETLGPQVRLVALTGYGQAADRARALEAGFDEFLVKPADLEDVERALLAVRGGF
jgi:CheY-like chemotaxis protein